MSIVDDKQINSLIDKLNVCRAENKALKQSRNALLALANGYLSYVRKNPDGLVSEEVIPIIETAIEKAGAQKEEEDK